MRKPMTLLLILLGTGCGAPETPSATNDSLSTKPTEQPAMSGIDAKQEMPEMDAMELGNGAPIRVTTRQASLAGVTFAIAAVAPVARTLRAVAMVVPNERELGIVSARVHGWVEVLHANETGRAVQVGEPLFELYSPELVTAQEELLLAKRLSATAGGDSLVAAARRRLALWDITEEEIKAIESAGQGRRRLAIRSPYAGHILEKHVIEGQMVRAGDRLFRIANLSTVWIEPAIFESDISLVRAGQHVRATFDALPGQVFRGRVTFVYPELDMQTRTLKVRVEIPNPRLLIKPMMYGVVAIEADAPHGVSVPLGAVLPTGTRDIAFVVRGASVIPTDIVMSARGDSAVLVSDGLVPGDTVVASATFLFDSESQLAAAMAGIMLNMGMGLDMGGMQMEGMDEMDMPGMQLESDTPESMPDVQKDRANGRGRGP